MSEFSSSSSGEQAPARVPGGVPSASMGRRPPKAQIERARRTRRIEAAALGILAALPLLPYFTFLVRAGVPRFGLIGDLALVEHATRHVWTGETLVGTPSRFGWSQPGPFFFYFAAPFQAIAGTSSTGVYLAATFVSVISAVAIVACARMYARRAHAIAALLVVLAWIMAFGSVTASPWSPMLVVLPLFAFLLNAAMIARGKSGASYPALVFGTFAAQTHVCAFPVVLAATIVAIAAFFIGARKREASPEATAEKWRIGIAAALGLILAVPPIVEQIIAPTGNFRRIVSFFVNRQAPLVPFGAAVQQWMTMMAWLPYRVSDLTLLREEFVPPLVRGDEIYLGTSTFPAAVAGMHVGMGVMCAMIAWKRRDLASVGLLGIGALANAVSVLALQAVVGVSAPHLILWTTAASCTLWVGVFSTILSAIGASAIRSERFVNTAITPILVFGLTMSVATATVQRWALSKHPAGIGSHPELRPDLQRAYAGLHAHLKKESLTPVVHLEGLHDIALGFYLELEKDRIDVRAPAAERGLLVGARPDTLQRPLHVWFGSAAVPHRLAACTEVIAKSGDLVVLGSGTAPASCAKEN